MSRAVLLFLVALLCSAPARAASDPAAVVTSFHAALTDVMERGQAIGCKGRLDKLDTVIGNTFDMDFVASHILRRRWETLSPQQRSAFTTMMKNLTVQTYASNFSHPGAKFETLETKDLSATRKQVRTKLTPAHDEPVTLDYFVQKFGEDWRVINVIANGVSDLALRSSQYDKVFEGSGFDGLMDKLQKQITADRAACA